MVKMDQYGEIVVHDSEGWFTVMGDDEILPYTDRITLESESKNEKEALRLLDRGLEICKEHGLMD